MIFTGLINFFVPFISTWIDAIPTIALTFTGDYFNGFIGFLNMCTYIFPLYAFSPLIAIVVSLNMFRLGIALLKVVWSVLPIV